MLRVLRHYMTLRKVLLVLSETALLSLAVLAGMSFHLWGIGDESQRDEVTRRLAQQGLSLTEASWRCFMSAIMVSVLAQIAISFNELYDFSISATRHERAARFLGSAGGAILLVVFLVAVADVWNIERALEFPGLPLTQRLVWLAFTLMVGFALLYFWRNLFHFILNRLHFDQRILIIGAGSTSSDLLEEILSRPESGYLVAGLLSTPSAGRRGDPEPEEPQFPTFYAPTELASIKGEKPSGGRALTESVPDLVERLAIDSVVVAMNERRGRMPTDALLDCRLRGIQIEEVSSFYERITGKIPVEGMRPSYLIFNRGFVKQPLARTAKRVLDLVLAGTGLALASPAMLLTAIAVRMDSSGPILYRQERTGRYGVPFVLIKFRSMREDAEASSGPVWASDADPRITRVGNFIRRTRLDELPQLWNILNGDMSLVGPRPERPNFVQELSGEIPYYTQRHIARPGLTGWAQINYPYGNTVEDSLKKLQYDLFYIKYQSLLFDLSIMLNTVKTVVLRKGS